MRYTEFPFPTEAFTPGRDPRPSPDAEGQALRREDQPVGVLSPEDWPTSEHYLYGVDLYNAGYFWEAHEAWEGLWYACKRDEIQSQFIRGLIQCAAGCLKVRLGAPRGVQKLFEQGTERLNEVAAASGALYMGVEVARFASEICAFGASEPASVEGWPRLELAGL